MIVPTLFLYFVVKESTYGGPSEEPGGSVSSAGSAERPERGRSSVFYLLLLPGFATSLAIQFLIRFTDKALPPIIPLYLIELNTPSAQLATITGFVVALGAMAAGGSAMFYGRWARPQNTRLLLVVALTGGVTFSVLLAFAQDWIQVAGLRLMLGMLAGGTASLGFAYGLRLAPSGRSATTLAVLTSSGQLGGALSAVMVGLVSQFGLHFAFLANAGAYLLAVVLAALPARQSAPAASPEPAAEVRA
jgi:MFS family permease